MTPANAQPKVIGTRFLQENVNRSHWIGGLLAGLVLVSPVYGTPALADPRLRVELVAAGLATGFSDLINSAVFVSPTSLLVASRADGRVRRVDLAAGVVAGPGPVVLDLPIVAPNPADSQAEYGVQAMTLHPNFAVNGWVYIRYDQSRTPPDDSPQSSSPDFATGAQNVTKRYVVQPAPGAGPVTSMVLDASIRAATIQTRYHHGGPAAFGPDGKLYSCFGDQRLANEVSMNGNLGAYFFPDTSIVSRLNDDGTVPADNPFGPGTGNNPATASWFAYGLRNPFGLGFDPATGDLWVTDNGEDSFDEINRLPRGANGGAKRVAGPIAHPDQPGNPALILNIPGATYTDPVYSFQQTCGITALAFLHGSALGPAFDDRLVVTNYNSGYLWWFPLNTARSGMALTNPGLAGGVDERPSFDAEPVGTPAEETLMGRGFGGLYSGALSVLRSPDERVYVLTVAGQLYRITRSCWADVAATDGSPGADGQLDNGDFQLFFTAFFSADCAACGQVGAPPPACNPADIAPTDGDPSAGPDGCVDNGDFSLFFQSFFGGCG